MSTVSGNDRAAIARLARLNTDELYQNLGVRLKTAQVDPVRVASFEPHLPEPTLEALGPVEDLREFGERFFNRLSGLAYDAVCGSGEENKEDRQRFQDAFEHGKEAMTVALATLLVGQLGLLPAVAAAVAALVVGLFFKAAYPAGCELWKEKLPAA